VVIQAIPTFAMAVFKIPKNICKEITGAMAAFWCGDTKTHKKCIGVLGGECVFLK
jgi:hypothetical protein